MRETAARALRHTSHRSTDRRPPAAQLRDQFARPCLVERIADPHLRCTFKERDLAERARQRGVAHLAVDSGGTKRPCIVSGGDRVFGSASAASSARPGTTPQRVQFGRQLGIERMPRRRRSRRRRSPRGSRNRARSDAGSRRSGSAEAAVRNRALRPQVAADSDGPVRKAWKPGVSMMSPPPSRREQPRCGRRLPPHVQRSEYSCVRALASGTSKVDQRRLAHPRLADDEVRGRAEGRAQHGARLLRCCLRRYVDRRVTEPGEPRERPPSLAFVIEIDLVQARSVARYPRRRRRPKRAR